MFVAALAVVAALIPFGAGWFVATMYWLPTPTTDAQSATVTAYATVALAAVGSISIVANVYLGFVAWQTVRAARDQATQERRQVDAMQRQLKLLEDQRLDAKAVAFPLIRAGSTMWGPASIDGSVEYVQGSEPARQVRLWISVADGNYFADIGTMTPRDQQMRYVAPAIPIETWQATLQGTPFADLLVAETGTRGRLVLSWTGLDGTRGQYRAELRSATGGWTETDFGRLFTVDL